MEVIDLLNKIVNGEAVPKMIYYGAKTYHYNNYNHSYIHYNIMDKEEYLTTNYRIEQILNDEIEIIEEKIEEDKLIEKMDEINPDHWCWVAQNKINELIDEVNKLKKESDK